MYHLGQKEFLDEWKASEGQNRFIVTQDLDFLECLCIDWKKPADWCGWKQKDGRIRFRRVEDGNRYLRECCERQQRLECNSEYIWTENYIREWYRQRSREKLEELEEEARRQGFQMRVQGDELCFEGEGSAAGLYRRAAELSGDLRTLALQEEGMLAEFHEQIQTQLEEGVGEPFLFTQCKAWQLYYPHQELWNRIEDGRLIAGGLAQNGVLVVSIAEVLADRNVYSYLKRVLEEKRFTDWQQGDRLTEFSEIDPIPYEGQVILYGSMEWLLLWEQSDPQWARTWRVVSWKNQCPCSGMRRRELRKYLGNRSLWEETILLNVMKRGAESGHMWTDTKRIERFLEDPEVKVEEWLRREDEWWGKRENLSASGIGNINGMAVLSAGERRIGVPMTIQAICSKRKKNRSLENHSGPIYRKSMEIVKEYWESLGSTKQFAVVMERNHNYLEGDSAAAAQFYAILSAAARVEPRRGIAVTGAMNLQGDVLAVGGITEKIEGCYFGGGVGVIYPEENERDVALRPSVQRAVDEGRFFLYAIRGVEEGAEILFGKKWKSLIRKI